MEAHANGLSAIIYKGVHLVPLRETGMVSKLGVDNETTAKVDNVLCLDATFTNYASPGAHGGTHCLARPTAIEFHNTRAIDRVLLGAHTI